MHRLMLFAATLISLGTTQPAWADVYADLVPGSPGAHPALGAPDGQGGAGCGFSLTCLGDGETLILEFDDNYAYDHWNSGQELRIWHGGTSCRLPKEVAVREGPGSNWITLTDNQGWIALTEAAGQDPIQAETKYTQVRFTGVSASDCTGHCASQCGTWIDAVETRLPDDDFDGVVNEDDNCVDLANGPANAPYGCEQEDADEDGYGTVCDTDVDNDGATSLVDLAYILDADAVLASTTDPGWTSAYAALDFDCDGVVTFLDRVRVLDDVAANATPGDSGLSCADPKIVTADSFAHLSSTYYLGSAPNEALNGAACGP